ncbi:TetR/AcrR family transcriptional regulator [Paenibacillus glycanilyticus]|uniref:TetR/AcrR family transcriptional regulator n=1 Tax=Paenibacillus glycanilyticus TaxID=126569 RepID=UPI00203E9245|nr:TetR/AcrR family transcriptional regulator [Paenibacillus glycanilyticus]MCM3628210.1 TetR/AcrR family transcriptional regulator [Paenibacillus glycanilyticus]
MLEKETSRHLKGKATKKKIFAIAKELILSKGYNKVTVDEICEKCEISKGTFYIYYKSKEDIVRKLYRDDMSEYMDEHFGKYVQENKDANPADKLKTFMMVALGFPSTVGEELTKLTFVVYLSLNSTETSFFSDCIKQELLYEAIEEGRTQSLFSKDLSTEEIVNYVYSFLTGACITWCLSEAGYDMGKESEKYVDALIKGLQ